MLTQCCLCCCRREMSQIAISFHPHRLVTIRRPHHHETAAQLRRIASAAACCEVQFEAQWIASERGRLKWRMKNAIAMALRSAWSCWI